MVIYLDWFRHIQNRTRKKQNTKRIKQHKAIVLYAEWKKKLIHIHTLSPNDEEKKIDQENKNQKNIKKCVGPTQSEKEK